MAAQRQWRPARKSTEHYAPTFEPSPTPARAFWEIHQRGLAVVLATSAPDDELKELRLALDADDAIDGATTADDVEQSKPDPEVFPTAMERYGIDPRRAFAVGGSVWDVEAAQSAGIACITVESGLQPT